MSTNRKEMMAAITLIKAICSRMSCDECPLDHGGWCEAANGDNAPCNWEVSEND